MLLFFLINLLGFLSLQHLGSDLKKDAWAKASNKGNVKVEFTSLLSSRNVFHVSVTMSNTCHALYSMFPSVKIILIKITLEKSERTKVDRTRKLKSVSFSLWGFKIEFYFFYFAETVKCSKSTTTLLLHTP